MFSNLNWKPPAYGRGFSSVHDRKRKSAVGRSVATARVPRTAVRKVRSEIGASARPRDSMKRTASAKIKSRIIQGIRIALSLLQVQARGGQGVDHSIYTLCILRRLAVCGQATRLRTV